MVMPPVRDAAAAAITIILVLGVIYGALFMGHVELLPIIVTLTTLAVSSYFGSRSDYSGRRIFQGITRRPGTGESPTIHKRNADD